MKAKYFKKIRNQVKWYKVSYRDNLLFSFSDEKEILAKSPENACVRYHKRTGCFVNKYCDTCKNFKPDERVLDDDEMEKVIEESAKQHYSDLCALNHPLRFKVNHGYSDLYDGGFYRNGCKDYKKIDNE